MEFELRNLSSVNWEWRGDVEKLEWELFFFFYKVSLNSIPMYNDSLDAMEKLGEKQKMKNYITKL